MADTNLAVQDPSDSVDSKVNDYFSNYYKAKLAVNSEHYEVVKSYFQSITPSDDAVASLTAAVLQTSSELDLNPVDVIEQFKASNIKAAIPMFLNMSRRNTSLLGFLKASKISENIKRQIQL